MPGYADDAVTVASSRTSVIAPGSRQVSYLPTSSELRYEGGTITATGDPNAQGAYDT